MNAIDSTDGRCTATQTSQHRGAPVSSQLARSAARFTPPLGTVSRIIRGITHVIARPRQRIRNESLRR